MDQNIQTLELAKLYERQEYYEDALKIYRALAEQAPGDTEIAQAVERVNALIGTEPGAVRSGIPAGKTLEADASVTGEPPSVTRPPIERIAGLCEKWIRLIVLRHRFRNFKTIKTRLN